MNHDEFKKTEFARDNPADGGHAPDTDVSPGDVGESGGDVRDPAVFVSGLRNPSAAVRSVGMVALFLETLVLLLALQPMRQLSTASTPIALGVIGGLAVLPVIAAMLLRHGWAWKLALALQVVIATAGLIHWAMLVLGVIFLLIWVYILRVRRIVLGTDGNPRPSEY